MVKNKRNTAPVVVGNGFHDAMNTFFKLKKISKRYQVELALEAFFKKESPDIFKNLKNSKNP